MVSVDVNASLGIKGTATDFLLVCACAPYLEEVFIMFKPISETLDDIGSCYKVITVPICIFRY